VALAAVERALARHAAIREVRLVFFDLEGVTRVQRLA